MLFWAHFLWPFTVHKGFWDLHLLRFQSLPQTRGEGTLSTSMSRRFCFTGFYGVRGGKCRTKHGKTCSFQTQGVNVQHALLQLLKCRYFTACHLIQPNSPVTVIVLRSTPSSHYYAIILHSQYSVFKQGL